MTVPKVSSVLEGASHGGRVGDRVPWWAVLAVSLALMALVVSLSRVGHATSPSAVAKRGQKPTGGSPRLPARAGHRRSPEPVGPPSARRAQQNPPSGSAGAGAANGSVASPPTAAAADVLPPPVTTGGPMSPGPPDASGTTTPTTVTVPAAGTTTTTAVGPPTSGPSSESEPGNLEYPGNVSASYQVAASGSVTASAGWTGAPDLTLSVDCPGGQDVRTGASGLAVTEPSGSSGPAVACTVTLAETSTEPATVSYVLTIDPGIG